MNSVEQVIRIEEDILGLFKKELESNNYQHKVFLHDEPKYYQNDWAWLSQAQHYGIPTRLLDWTLKPEVALFFALDDENMDHEDGQFLVLYVPANGLFTGEDDGFYETHPSKLNDTRFLNPCFYYNDHWDNAVGEVRRARQHGKFSLQTYKTSLRAWRNKKN